MIELKDLKHVALKGHGYFCVVKQYVNSEGKNFALKELKKDHYTNEEYRYRLLREINILKTLQGCKNIIRLVNHGNSTDDHSMWYLMPYAKFNLYEYIKKYNQEISQDTRFEIVEQIINAIKYAHDRDILHRDISPNNILVFFKDGKEIIKVTDFGLGKTTESLSNYTGSSASNYGQILYVSPEQRTKLKDASVQSDIFSLGKLIYFVFTGKDPDNMKTFELSSLVTKAIDENPMNRFNNMDELKERFDTLKKLYVDKDIPIEYITLEEYFKSGEELEYMKLHALLVNGKYITHPYHDYISEVNSYFLTSGNLEQYYKNIGDSIKDFITTYIARLKECYGTTRWPFNAMGTFGEILTKVVQIVKDDYTRLICIEQLWYIAFEADQWAVQKQIKIIFNDKYITKSIEIQLSEYIIGSETEVEMHHFENLKLPPIVKKSIIKGNEIAKTNKEKLNESRKNEFDDIF